MSESHPPAGLFSEWGIEMVAVGCFGKRDKNKEHPQIVIRFDVETFEQIRTRAVANRTSFSKQVRELIEIGLETVSETV